MKPQNSTPTRLCSSVLQYLLAMALAIYIFSFIDFETYEILESCSSVGNTTRERSKLYFLKVQKSAGSTVQNIMFRYGRSRTLDFFLSRDSFDSLNIGAMEDIAPPDGQYDMFVHYSRYHPPTIKEVMRPGAAFVTILRNPADQFESLFNFYDLEKFSNTSLDQLISDPSLAKNFQVNEASKRLGINQMSWDLGLSEKSFSDEYEVENLIRRTEKDFDLVMIVEHMEASVVLLADLMGWPLSEVSYLNLNQRVDKPQLSASQKKELAQVNEVDSRLYRHFLERFIARVQQYGIDRMSRDVSTLMTNNHNLKQRCVIGIERKDGYNVAFYTLKPKVDELCKLAVKSEFEFTDELRIIQRHRSKALRNLRRLIDAEQDS